MYEKYEQNTLIFFIKYLNCYKFNNLIRIIFEKHSKYQFLHACVDFFKYTFNLTKQTIGVYAEIIFQFNIKI